MSEPGFYAGECAGCRRLRSTLRPAPGTPPGKLSGNLYCDRCRRAGLAVFREPKPAPPVRVWAWVLGIILVLTVCVILALLCPCRCR